MFTTIVRNEARLTTRPLLIGAGLIALIYAVSLGLVALNWTVISSLALSICILAAVGLVVAAVVYLLVHYARSMYGRVGYFTMTIPVRGRVLFAGKAVWAYLVILIAALVAFPAGVVALGVQSVANGGTFGSVLDPFKGLADHPWLLACVIVFALSMIALTIAQYSFYISVGSEARFGSLGAGGPVIVYVITYVVLQLLTVVAMVAIPIALSVAANPELVSFNTIDWVSNPSKYDTQSLIPVGFVPIYLVSLVVFVIWTIRSIERRTSLR